MSPELDRLRERWHMSPLWTFTLLALVVLALCGCLYLLFFGAADPPDPAAEGG